MFDKNIRQICINVYNKLNEYNIKGVDKKLFITETFNLHINSLYNWIKKDNEIHNCNKYSNNKIDLVIENFVIYNFNQKFKVKKIKKNVKEKFNVSLSYKDILCILKTNNLKYDKNIIKNNINEFIIDNIKINNYMTANELIKLINNKFKITVSTTYIYNVLTKHNYSYKKIRINSNPYSKEKQKEQLIEIKNKILKSNIDNIISIDEISVKEFENLDKGWSLKGIETEVNDKNKKINNKRYSILMASSNKKIINYTIVEKGIKTNNFNNFMLKLNRMDKEKNNIYFLDNARIHKTKSFNKIKEDYKLNIVYNAPYQSKYNPIEYVFSSLRKQIQKYSNKSYNELIKIINNFIKNIEEKKLNNIFNHVLKLLNQI
jgi:transposase